MVGFVQSHSGHTRATLDMDASWLRPTSRRRSTATRSAKRINRSRPIGRKPTRSCTRSFVTAMCRRAISNFGC